MATLEPITVDFEPRSADTSVAAILRATADQLAAESNWDALEWVCAHPLAPVDLLLQLARISSLHSVLGHRSSPRELLEHMADHHFYPEAVITLAIRDYHDEQVSPDQFKSFVERHHDNYWMLKSLVYELDDENIKTLHVKEACRQHTHAHDLEQLQDRLATIRRAKQCSEESEIRRLYGMADPKVVLALAENPNTPGDLLEQMTGMQRTQNAGRIRLAATHNLSARNR